MNQPVPYTRMRTRKVGGGNALVPRLHHGTGMESGDETEYTCSGNVLAPRPRLTGRIVLRFCVCMRSIIFIVLYIHSSLFTYIHITITCAMPPFGFMCMINFDFDVAGAMHLLT